MSDDLEQRLQQAFRRGSLPAAPASLGEALDRVPDIPVRSRRSMGRRSTFGLLAAALLVTTVGALAISGGSQRLGPTSPTVAPIAAPTPETGLRLEYAVLPSDGVKPGPADLATVVSIIERRVAATGIVGATVQAGAQDRIIVKLPGVTDATPIRRLIGQTGRIDFVPLGQTQVTIHQTIDSGLYPPLFSADQVESATVGADQNGQSTIDFVLKPEGARLFADYTARSIGDFFAITVDGVVVSAPVIQSEIKNGEVQITQGPEASDAEAAATIVAYLNYGAQPFPIQEIGSQPAGSSPSAP